jgi:hypothetical protein
VLDEMSSVDGAHVMLLQEPNYATIFEKTSILPLRILLFQPLATPMSFLLADLKIDQ